MLQHLALHCGQNAALNYTQQDASARVAAGAPACTHTNLGSIGGSLQMESALKRLLLCNRSLKVLSQ
jgi:hypothetical protein